jgi:hypothetical protein
VEEVLATRALKSILVSSAIGLRKYRIPSDLRSQAEHRLVSTMVGDHMGILGVEVFAFLLTVDQRDFAQAKISCMSTSVPSFMEI